MKQFLTVLFIASLFATKISAQENPTASQYKSQFDSLSQVKSDFLKKRSEYQKLIDSLYTYSLKLDTMITKYEHDKLYDKYGAETASKLTAHMVWLGMSEEMLLDSWGKPDKTNVDKYSYGTFKQHSYGDITFFFRDGKLIDWEQEGQKGGSDKPIILNRKK